MSFEIQGKLHKKFDTESKTATFQAREFVILIEEGNYPQYIKFQLTQDKCDIVDQFETGNEIKVWFDLRGREWNEKYFTNLNAWKIEKVNQDPISENPKYEESDFPIDSDMPEEISDNFEDDLPF
ncbi:MAG: DUF3127 domain-containing protein [Saprospiraceae bacterium]